VAPPSSSTVQIDHDFILELLQDVEFILELCIVFFLLVK
jgi:hypothetical protein